jgi:hypothetical protein
LKRGGIQQARFLIEQKIKTHGPINIIIATGLTASFVGLAFLSATSMAASAGIVTERNLANLRVNALLERENRRAPRRRNRK